MKTKIILIICLFVFSLSIIAQAGDQIIKFTSVPKKGSFNNLYGKVSNCNPKDYAVAVYIRVGNGWWTKPYWDHPKTGITRQGRWVCDITTGGIDEQANAIVAFLIPKSYDPPLAYGEDELPREIWNNYVTKVSTTR